MKMFSFSGGPPWVIAEDTDSARTMAGCNFSMGLHPQPPRMLPDDELFTMFYDEDGLDTGSCNYGCDPTMSHNHTTKSAKDWCMEFPEGHVIYEY